MPERSMKVLGHRRDDRPVSSLESSGMSREMWVGGILIMILAHVGVPLAILFTASLLASTVGASNQPPRYIDEHIVEARFVQKGVKREPDKLPDRVVPLKSTAPDDATVVSKNMNPEKPEKPKEKPPDPTQDLLTRIGDRAQQFAEIADRKEKEGDPDGVEGGTATEAQAGDLYAGQLYNFFKRHWTIPNTLSDPSKLVAHAEFEITRDLRIGAFSVVKSSSDALFDQSVEDLFNKLRAERIELPEPPAEVAYKFLGQKIVTRFHGRR
jgi:hypothetical protein